MRVNQIQQPAPVEQVQNTAPTDGSFKFMLASHVKEAELQELDRGDMIVDCDGIISQQDSFYFFQAETETAWTPNVESLQKLLCERYKDKIKLIYFTDASEDGIYITNDYNGVFVNEQ